MSAKILLADDDASLRLVLSQALAKEGYSVRATSNVATLGKWVRDGEGDLVVSDVYMGEDSLFDTLPTLRAARPQLPVIVMSAQSTVLTALSAAGAGAYDYLPKPFDLDDLVGAVRRALGVKPDARARATAQAAEREERLPLIGRSAAMQDVYRVMARVTGTDLTVLIEGESGAGKERVARALHEYSRRREGRFTTLCLAAISRDALERELGGSDGKNGLLAQAEDGTLFLDDVDDASPDVQTRLLRLLQDSDGEHRPEARIVSASKRNLGELVRAGQFRQDLFYRLNVVTIRLPALRERLDDIGDLARAFLVRAKRDGLPEKTIDARAIEMLKTHEWPGNVRELENLLRRAAALCPENVIGPREIERELAAGRAAFGEASNDQEPLSAIVRRRLASEFASAPGGSPADGLYDRVIAEVEAPLITLTLEATRGNQIKAASILGINRNTLRKKIQTLGLKTRAAD
ncbi:MAG: sigma 54-interacting transcriptional regulator [Hyphomonadaceae bacterium]